MILTATSLELFTLFQTWTTFSQPKDFYPPHPAIEQVRNATGQGRVLQTANDLAFADIFATPNILAAYSIPSVDAYESIQYQSTRHFLKNTDPEIAMSLAGIGLTVHPASHPAVPGTEKWTTLTESNGYSLRKNPFLPAPIAEGSSAAPKTNEQILDALKFRTGHYTHPSKYEFMGISSGTEQPMDPHRSKLARRLAMARSWN
jgi:hypothetical protein